MSEMSLAALKTPKKFNVKYNIFAMASFVVFALVLVLPFLTSGVHSGHDIEYHFSMIRQFNDAWKNGNFLGKINNLAGQDYGYANSMFYTVIPAAIASVFMNVLKLNITGAVGLEIGLLFAANGIVFFWFLKRLFGRLDAAWIGALLYQFTPYVLNQFYVRFSFSEIFLSLAIPMIFWGLCELFLKNNNAGFLALFTLGYSLAILCHLNLTVYLTVFVIIFLCFHFKEIFAGKKIFPLLISAILVLLICAYFYVPMLKNFSLSNTTSLSYTAPFLWFNGFWAFFLPWLLFSSIISLVAIVKLAKFMRANKGNNSKNVVCLFVLLNLSFICSTCIFPWFLLPNFVGMIQYVWRLFLLNATFVYVALAYLIFKFKTPKKLIKSLVFITIISACSFGLNAVSAHSKNGFWFANTSVDINMYQNQISNQSDNYGIGSHKKLNYTPNVATQNYIFTRANAAMVLNANVKVKEFANYFSLNQISFIVPTSLGGQVLLNIPYQNCQGLKFYQFSTDVDCQNLNITAQPAEWQGKQFLQLNLADFKGESKITIAYDQTFKNYLIKNPFEFITLEGQARATNFVKKNASTYTVEFETDGAKVELPTYFYYGYNLTFKPANGGDAYTIEPKLGSHGFVEINLTESGKLFVEFNPGYVKTANKISAVGVCGLCIALPTFVVVDAIVKKQKNKKRS